MTATLEYSKDLPSVSEGQSWFHPDMIIGACIEGIGSDGHAPQAPALRQGRFCAPRALEANG
jgi:hypothetical protein